ncbi:unnamed protein product (plasmid) [Mycetohabitans rhizoxinica HKI 454]|uniref:Uncharacterized protein n=1 Tax=Mycetohabitans rhizoxinica (strain DSM 19002 / CIP 109453 / HKI 454) TaxID=882378 RepID=E5ATW6_MYCRK|nr:unnamed protein product [Mycetohabitans rhizoxinica HKI 454]
MLGWLWVTEQHNDAMLNCVEPGDHEVARCDTNSGSRRCVGIGIKLELTQ